MQRYQALSTINQTLLHKIPPNGIIAPGNLLPGLVENNYEDVNEETCQASSFSCSLAYSPLWDQASTSHNSSENQVPYCLLFRDNFNKPKVLNLPKV